ncbi:MAG: hypothetical protein V8T24_07890 [Roseburia hominis]
MEQINTEEIMQEIQGGIFNSAVTSATDEKSKMYKQKQGPEKCTTRSMTIFAWYPKRVTVDHKMHARS